MYCKRQIFFFFEKNQIQIEEAIVKSRNEQLEKLAAECDVNMEDLNGTVQPIIDSCTKDAILVKYCCSPFSALPFFSPLFDQIHQFFCVILHWLYWIEDFC